MLIAAVMSENVWGAVLYVYKVASPSGDVNLDGFSFPAAASLCLNDAVRPTVGFPWLS